MRLICRMRSLLKHLLIVALLTLLASGVSAQAKEKESLYDRVLRTGVVRACYAMNPPVLMKDPNTGQLSGIFYEAVNKAFANVGIKVEWTEEVGWGLFPATLMADRCEIEACAAWVTPARAKVCDFSIPLFYSPLGVWVRPDDHRFDQDFLKINDPGVTCATLDGEMSSVVAKEQFPLAKVCELPQLGDISQNLLNVVTKKGDVAFVEAAIAHNFLKQNPGKLRNIAEKKPFRVFGNAIMFKRDEVEFKHMVDLLFTDLLNSGYIETLIKKYEPFPGAYYRVTPGYKAP